MRLSALSSFALQAPRMIGITSVADASLSGRRAATIGLRPRCSRASAADTISIMRS